MESFLSLYILCSTHLGTSDSSKYPYYHCRCILLVQYLLSKLCSVSFLLWISQLPRDRQSLSYYCWEILKYLLTVIIVVRGKIQGKTKAPNSQVNAFPDIERAMPFTDWSLQGRVISDYLGILITYHNVWHMVSIPRAYVTRRASPELPVNNWDCSSTTKKLYYVAPLPTLKKSCLDLYFSSVKWGQ